MNWEEEASDIAGEDGVSIVEEANGQPMRFFRLVPDYGNLNDD